MNKWEFFVCCHKGEDAIWTRWRWQLATGSGSIVTSEREFTTLPACWADAIAHGFDAIEESAVVQIEAGDPMLRERSTGSAPVVLRH